MIAVLIFYVLFLAVYASLAGMALWHVKKYELPDDSSKWVGTIFVMGSIVMTIVSFVLLFLIPWSA